MNMALPAHEIDDSQARLLIDWLVDQPGITRQRGPVDSVIGIPKLPRPSQGIFATLDPQGNTRYAAITGDGSNGYVSVLAADNSAWIDLAWPYATGTTIYPLVDAKPALGGGL